MNAVDVAWLESKVEVLNELLHQLQSEKESLEKTERGGEAEVELADQRSQLEEIIRHQKGRTCLPRLQKRNKQKFWTSSSSCGRVRPQSQRPGMP